MFVRVLIEFWFFIKISSNDKLLCFGNFPPLLRIKGKVYVFLQNRYLIDDCKIQSKIFQFKVFLQRIFFQICASKDYTYIMQSHSMKGLFAKKMPRLQHLSVFPFISLEATKVNKSKNKPSRNISKVKTYKFIYVASGEKHKNHEVLIKAWALLAKEGIFPLLYLTLNKSEYPSLYSYIQASIKKNNLKIINQGSIPHKLVLKMYKKVDALIYPSLFESFGLPLIESATFDLPIIASELDFVRDFTSPKETFNPHSPNSVASSVKRFMRVEKKNSTLHTPKQFIKNFFYD